MLFKLSTPDQQSWSGTEPRSPCMLLCTCVVLCWGSNSDSDFPNLVLGSLLTSSLGQPLPFSPHVALHGDHITILCWCVLLVISKARSR
ncbi:hypothetical protein BDA96_06G021600 [Sorghum bicolor]|uniref:Uncharacterized protein n=2 Tax=Sorghum bicolor TaxID=4558 RepID=A0A921UB64_SORBI|nr:hypothetical protein BDA96_06G021600 [Sorghum bicolor]OQU81157.1 hypothetical protein SORBI_3006G019801 [Sorghum bicolor]